MIETNDLASWDHDGYARRWLQGETGLDISCAHCARNGDVERQLFLDKMADEYKCVR